MSFWQRLWGGLSILVGDPRHAATWEEARYAELAPPKPPPVDLGAIVFTEGGLSVLLLRWLTLVDPWTDDAYYMPLIWIEFVPEGAEPRHLALRLTAPPDRGRLTLRFPLSTTALRRFGALGVSLENWREQEMESLDDGTLPPQ